VGTNAKLRIAAGVILVLGLLALITGNTLVGVLLTLAGAVGLVYVLRMPDDEAGGTTTKRPKGAKSKLDSAIEAKKTASETPAPPRPGGGLPTWNPTALDTWSPPSLSEREEVEEEPAATSDWDTWGSWETDETADDTDTITLEDNPLDALDSLDDIDPIAEVERLEGIETESYDPLASLDTAEELDDFDFEDDFDESLLAEEEESPVVKKSSGGFSFSSAPAVINEEEIKTADDIMAASHATELELPTVEVGDGGDSELARLLAKVQARLSAYE